MKRGDFEKIERYIKGEATESERNEIEKLLSEGEENLYLRNRLNIDWEDILQQGSSADSDLGSLLDKIHHVIRRKEQIKKGKPLQRLIRTYVKMAAIMLIPVMLTGGLVYNHLSRKWNLIKSETAATTIIAPMGSRISFSLPDGTKGMLNSGSRLSYTMPFTTNRKMNLEGEAWFDVSHDKEHPFEISAGSSRVKVLGTSFNLSAYPTEKYVEVVLLKGRIIFSDSQKNIDYSIKPSERLVYKDGNITKTMADPSKYSAWTEGKLVFKGDPMAEVVRRIERWYNVRITLADKEIEKYSFRATFEDDKLDDVLKFLSMTSPIHYKISERNLLDDGTYTKEEITIFRNN